MIKITSIITIIETKKMGNQELTHKQKQDITDIFNRIFDKPLNKSYYTIKNDIILDGIEFNNIKEELKIKMGYFYKQLFCYLCNFTHPETEFDLINEKEQIFIKLKTDWSTDNHNAKESKFCLLSKYKRNNSNAKVYYICLNDKCKVHVDYTHHFGFQIITGRKAWEFFCQCADIDAIDLIDYLKALVHSRWKAWELNNLNNK